MRKCGVMLRPLFNPPAKGECHDATDNYRPTLADHRLITELKQQPIGHHSPDLQCLLNRMRGKP